MLWETKMWGEGLRLGEPDGCRILTSLLCCCDRGQTSYVWAASQAASFLKTPQSSWLHDFIAALKSSQFMGIFMQLALVQGFFSFIFISYFTWLFALFFKKEWLPFSFFLLCFFATCPRNHGQNALLWNKGEKMLYTSRNGQSLCSTSGNISLPGTKKAFQIHLLGHTL